MITSFFRPKGEAPAAGPSSSGKRPADAAFGGAAKSDTPSEPTGGAKARRRKACIHDSDEDEGTAEPKPAVTPAPLAEDFATQVESMESSAAASADGTALEAGVSGKAEPVMSKRSAVDVSRSESAATKSANVDKMEAVQEEAEEEEAEEEDGEAGEDDGVGSERDEDHGAASSSAAPSRAKVVAAKGKSKAAGSKTVMGATAAKIAYHKYDVTGSATWDEGKPVPYLFIARTFAKIEDESKRLLITEMMANAFRSVIATSPEALLPMMALSTGRLAPAYEGIELGIGDSIMIKAVSETCGRSVGSIKTDMEEAGDLGVVAMASRGKQVTLFKPKPLSIIGVFKSLKEIAQISGHEAMKRKTDKIKQMLVAAQEKEALYLIRSLQGKLRIGLAEQTALVALAHAFVLTSPPGRPAVPSLRGEALQERLAEAEGILKQVYSEMPNYEVLIPALMAHGIDELPKHASLTAGVPVKPMLAKPTKGLSEVLDRFSNCAFTCEYKYDGERAQIHLLADGNIKIFSRNSEDNSTKYPDIAALMPRAIKPHVRSIIIDSEAVAVDQNTGAILPFQVLSTRKRKDASVDDIGVKVCLYAFDLLYLNGESFLQRPLGERREALHGAFEVLPREFEFAQSSDAADVEKIQEFLMESIKGNCEGLMVKTLAVDATYEPSKRSLNWLKVKKDYLAGMTDSCDLVPIGAYYGKGKRTGVYGAYLLACYNADEEVYESICKIGTGFNDEALQSLYASLSEKLIDGPRKYYRVPEWAESSLPDVWFEACQVWEVLAADLSISPVHMAAAGLVDHAKGIALRFPRFLRVRDDKGVEDATNSEQIAQMYKDQACTKTSGGADDEDDY